MIEYSRHILSNGLRVILHKDTTTPLIALNVLYDVGSADEDPEHTGFAHLFEHLMFGGSENVKDFDVPIQEAGGENNAFTNCDMTNFFDILPAENIETAFWLESDRMRKLNFSQKNLTTQQKVVIEEFKETSLNEPYGDMWHIMSDLAYGHHPYSWPTIGKEINHIADATLQQVKDFFYKYYRPKNAVLSLCGNFEEDEMLSLIKKWFEDIEPGEAYPKDWQVQYIPPVSKTKRVEADVPADALYMAFNMPGRLHPDYYTYDLLSDILSEGRSSRLYSELLKEKQLFASVDAYISGTNDPGLFIIEGKLMDDVGLEQATEEVWQILENIKTKGVGNRELDKVKHKTESNIALSELSVLNKAISLGYYELLGEIELINTESDYYNEVTTEDIQRVAKTLFDREKYIQLEYKKKSSDRD